MGDTLRRGSCNDWVGGWKTPQKTLPNSEDAKTSTCYLQVTSVHIPQPLGRWLLCSFPLLCLCCLQLPGRAGLVGDTGLGSQCPRGEGGNRASCHSCGNSVMPLASRWGASGPKVLLMVSVWLSTFGQDLEFY